MPADSPTPTPTFGGRIRDKRLRLAEGNRAYSLRQTAQRVGIEPSYLSKIERGEQPPPGEETICRLARELGEDADVLLAEAGKVSGDLLAIIRRRPELVGGLLRSIRSLPNKRVTQITRQVRDGDW